MRVLSEVVAILPKNQKLYGPALENLVTLQKWLSPDHLRLAAPEESRRGAQRAIEEIGLEAAMVSLSPVTKSWERFALDLLGALRDTYSDLLILFREDEGEAQESLPRWQRSLIEHAEIPILLLSALKLLEFPPFTSLLIPMSGEISRNRALELGLKLASLKSLPVDIVHVASADETCSCGETRLEGLQEEFQHEYPRLIEQFIAQASPLSDVRQKLQLREFAHRCGCASDEIAKKTNENPKTLLLVEWKGRLGPGRAMILKKLYEEVGSPMLLIRELPEERLTLKVGKDFPARDKARAKHS